MTKRLLTIFAMLAVTFGAAAQQTFRSTLQDEEGQPVMYANIALMNAADTSFVRGTTSNDKGEFRIEYDSVPALLRISAIGYEMFYYTIDGSDVPLFIPVSKGVNLSEVKITDKKPLYSVDGEKDLYNVSEDPSVQTGTASDVLQNSPGIQVDAQGNISINGSASVEVWINDRPSHLSGEALTQYIKTLPANTIDRVEVIKNPSAKYGGGSPVINLITNQKVLKNSFLSFGANGSTKPSVSPWISYVYSNEKFNISAYLNYNGDRDETREESTARYLDANDAVADTSHTINNSKNRSRHSWMSLNASYEFDSMNSLTGWFGAYPSYISQKGLSIIERKYYNLDFSDSAGWDDYWLGYGGYGGLDFTHKFDNEGHQYSISVNGSFWGYQSNTTSFEHYTYQPQLSYDDKKWGNNLNGSGSLSFDYTWPYSKQGQLEMGADVGREHNHAYSLRDTLRSDGNYYTDYLRSDTATSPANSAHAYLSWQRKWGNYTLKTGGRVTYWNSNSFHEGLPQYDVVKHYFVFRPSLHMSYRTKDMHNFSLGYTYNSNPADASSLSTYPEYSIESFSTGNPLLTREYVHNLDAGWNKYFEKFGSVGLNGSYKACLNTRGSISDPQYVAFFDRVVPVTKPYNYGDSRRGSINANIMYRPGAFFNVRLNAGLTDDWYRVEARPGKFVEDELLSWDVSVRLWAKLWKKVEVFASGYYNSRAHSGWEVMGINEPRKGIDLGMSADFFDRKLSLYLNFDDIFDWNDWNTSSINPYNTSTSQYKYISRYITFGLTLRFGKMELEGQARTGATESTGGKGGK